MNLKKYTKVKACRVAYSRYSDLDDKVIKKATETGLPLIGGTALEVWAAATGTEGVRKRSDNDLDFIVGSISKSQEFSKWVKENIDPEKVKVDLMLVRSHDFEPYKTLVDGVLVMKPEYLLWQKLTRGNDRDKKDIKWLLSISDLSDEAIEQVIGELGITQEEYDMLVSIMES